MEFFRGSLKAKFAADAKGIQKNKASGFAFFTNRKLTDAERKKLKALHPRRTSIEIYHLERIASLLNQPLNFALRWEFLDIEMSKEEFLSFLQARDSSQGSQFEQLSQRIDAILTAANDPIEGDKLAVPLADLREFKRLLGEITGRTHGFSSLAFGLSSNTISELHVPLSDLREFARLLRELTGYAGSGLSFGIGLAPIQSLHVPLKELKEFAEILSRVTGHTSLGTSGTHLLLGVSAATVRSLDVPLPALKEYESTLDRIISKLREKRSLE